MYPVRRLRRSRRPRERGEEETPEVQYIASVTEKGLPVVIFFSAVVVLSVRVYLCFLLVRQSLLLLLFMFAVGLMYPCVVCCCSCCFCWVLL